MKPPRRDFSLGRLRASACSRLPGNHSAGQGSRKPRCRIHVSGPLRRLARGHVSMVSRWRKPGNRIFRGIPRVTAWHWPHGGQRLTRGLAAVARGGRGPGQERGPRREFGINGESSGKDRVNTNRRSSLVFSELRRVTCGVVVHKAVDNYRDVRITGGILWKRCGLEKNLK
jgi:hypothetical protein